MGNIQNRKKKNKRHARNWRNIIKMRKRRKLSKSTEQDGQKEEDQIQPNSNVDIQNSNFSDSSDTSSCKRDTENSYLHAHSALSDSETEQLEVNLYELRAPLQNGWKRETVIEGFTTCMVIRGDVFYYAPGSQLKLENIGQIEKILEGSSNLTIRNFSFSARPIIGSFLQLYGTEYIRWTEVEMAYRIDRTKNLKLRYKQAGQKRNDFLREKQSFKNDKIFCEDDISKEKILVGCGIINIGNSCFFNACFQALFHIRAVNIRLQKMRIGNCTCLMNKILNCFKNTHKENQSTFDPSTLYEAMRQEGNQDLLNGKMQDAQEFWMRIMKSMEKIICCEGLNGMFSHEFIQIMKCEICDNKSQIDYKASAHIIEICGRSTIQEALNAYFAEVTIQRYKCSDCKSDNYSAKKSFFFKNAPHCLVLVIGRFDNGLKKVKDEIELTHHLKISDTIFKDKPAARLNYTLVSTINHYGSKCSNGHYTTVSCSAENEFYEFNDDSVHRTNAISGRAAYILIYELAKSRLDISVHGNVDEVMDVDPLDHELEKRVNMQFTLEINDDASSIDYDVDELIEYDPDGVESTNANLLLMTDQGVIQDDIQQNWNENESVPNKSIPSESDNDEEGHVHHPQQSDHHENDHPLSGNRIVDFTFLVEQMKYIDRHSRECQSQMVFTKETKMGFRSIFYFECSECGIFHKVQSSTKNDLSFDVNKAATLGITSIGSGFYHLEEFCAHMNIPCMSSTTFGKANKKLQEDWWKLGRFHSESALKVEIDHAITTGNVDSAGNALITVICDGSWGKRSYGKGFSSLSGCAAIIGLYTKKVLYYDVKNKYCHICTLSYSKNNPPNNHQCNISYVGPSSNMETEIIVEGFKACEVQGARFNKLISDGDSSVYKEIRDLYPDLLVEKFECVNHLYKNARKKFTALNNDTTFQLKYRKLLKPSIGDDICRGVRSAAKHWKESNVNLLEKLENLEKDCLNAPYHYFGCHENCDPYFCEKTTNDESESTIDLLKAGGIFHQILNYCNIYFASNVRSLIENCTNNAAEELNNVIAKYLGGKRINYSLAGSYGGRVSAAVVQYNSNGHAGSEFHKFYSMNTDSSCLKLENARKRHYDANEAANQVKPRNKSFKDKSTKGYGDCRVDMSEHNLKIAKDIELDKLNTNRLNRERILTNTYGQKHNLEWLEVRKKMINCSYFGRIINSRSPKSYKTLLFDLLYSESEFGNSAELRHQRLYESEALKMFSLMHRKHDLEKTGIFIDKDISYLAASPLRLYGADALVNVKCPVKVFRKTFDEALSKKFKKWVPYLKKKDGEIHINIKSNWYAEAQGQLHITGRNYVYLIVWLGAEFTIKKIKADHSFWKKNMEKKLQFFFDEAMLKEIADPRKRRKMELRAYDSKTKTFT